MPLQSSPLFVLLLLAYHLLRLPRWALWLERAPGLRLHTPATVEGLVSPLSIFGMEGRCWNQARVGVLDRIGRSLSSNISCQRLTVDADKTSDAFLAD